MPGAGFFNAPAIPLPQGQIAVTSIAPGSSAEVAGLDVGDILIAMDGDRVDAATFNDRFNEKRIGSKVMFSVMRRDKLRSIAVTVGKDEPVTYSIKEKPGASAMQKKIFTSWLGEKSTK